MHKIFYTFALAGLMACAGANEDQEFKKGLDAYNRGRFQEAYRRLYPLAQKNNDGAQGIIANLYAEALVPQKDEKGYLYWLKRAAENGNSHAQYRYGMVLHEGISVKKDDEEAIEWLRQAASQGDSFADPVVDYYERHHRWYIRNDPCNQ